MSSTNKTANLGLPQWEGTDTVEHGDFNGAFAKIDEACGGQPWVKLFDISFEETKESFTLDFSKISFDDYGMIVFLNKFATEGKQMRINGIASEIYIFAPYSSQGYNQDYIPVDTSKTVITLGKSNLNVDYNDNLAKIFVSRSSFDKIRNIYFFCTSSGTAYKPGDRISIWGFKR